MKISKIFKYLIILIILIGIIMFCLKINKKDTEDAVNKGEEVESFANSGMKVILFGGSNMETKGNVNSMGYAIITGNDKLILVDGGRNIDRDLVKFYIDKYGNGKVDHWFITHPHSDHVGALNVLLEEENNLEIDNIYYSFLEDEWYKEHDTRGYESSHAMLENINSAKIKNRVECEEGQAIKIDNLNIDIIRTPNPEIIHSDNGNDASMTFKVTANDVDKSIIFLGDSYVYASKELLAGNKEMLKSDCVQMSHHGQYGVTKEVYEVIAPDVCLFNCPKYLYDNDNGGGYNSGKWQSVEVRGWVEELGAKSYLAFEGDQILEFTKTGIFKIEE